MKLLYQKNDFPIFQNRMYDSEQQALACPKGDIRLVEDETTGLVFNAAFRPELMHYDQHYQNEQAVSAAFTQHLQAVAAIIERHLGKDSLVEVGCGKGFFLELLLQRGFDITGFDPTYEGSNLRVQKRYFSPGVIDQAQGLVLRHVLEHVTDPVSFLAQIRDANGGSGKIYIEVPCFDWICDHRAWFDIFYEHVNYFRRSDFYRMFENVLECGHLFGGQYTYVVAELSSLRTPKYDPYDVVRFPGDFGKSFESLLALTPKSSAVWGGASKGVIFSLLRARAGHPVDLVIDINPAKQNKYLAATGVMVLSPSDGLKKLSADATIFVMNSNYLDEIKALSNNLYNYIAIDHE